jgi:hypothetical protein
MTDDEVELAVVVDAELFRIEAVVRWLDAADARLKRRGSADRAAPDRATAPGPPARRKTGVRR